MIGQIKAEPINIPYQRILACFSIDCSEYLQQQPWSIHNSSISIKRSQIAPRLRLLYLFIFDDFTLNIMEWWLNQIYNIHANYALFSHLNPLEYIQNAVEGKRTMFTCIRIDREKYRIIKRWIITIILMY